jgi:polar amino acid transport system substrate-binding protein
MAMRSLRIALSALLGATTLSGVTLITSGALSSAASGNSLASCAKKVTSEEIHKGVLTVATDSPAYTPWFVSNKPSNGKGYESAVAYAIAKELGIRAADVKWVVEPFDSSYIPGPKSFDFDINEISYTAERAHAVTFSVSYYDVNQSIVALKTNPIVTKHTPKELKSYVYGDQIGTTGLAYINNEIKPTTPAKVFSTLDQAVLALQTKQIDAIVIDTPTGQYMAADQITNKAGKSIATQVGQFPSTGEHYGLLFSKGNPLAACVNVAIDALKTNGTLAALQKKWLNIYTSVAVIQP